MTLAELAGQGGQSAAFSLELDTLATDGSTSLVQRAPLDPAVNDLPLVALLEAPGDTYRVECDGVQTTLDRSGAAALVDQLRAQGKHWQVYAVQPAQPAQPADPAQPRGPDQPAGPAVRIVTDLLADRFQHGGLQQVFAVLQAAADGSPSTTLTFDPAHAGGTTWQPSGVTIPPFKYRITYLYAGGVFRQTEGTESGLTLVLDPPAVS
jgi:hypothetical protein